MIYDNKPFVTNLAKQFEAETGDTYLDRHQNRSMEIYYSVNDEYVKWLENKIITAELIKNDALIDADVFQPRYEQEILIDGKACVYIGPCPHQAFDENWNIIEFTHYKLIN